MSLKAATFFRLSVATIYVSKLIKEVATNFWVQMYLTNFVLGQTLSDIVFKFKLCVIEIFIPIWKKKLDMNFYLSRSLNI